MLFPPNSPQSSEHERIIPLADAPEPAQPEAALPPPAEGPFTPDPLNTLKYSALIVEAISKVFDPEIPVNVYELGLIYDIQVDSGANVSIRMTLTAPACPAAQTIPLDVERHVRALSGINDVTVAVVWDPPWTRDRMSEMAKLTLGMY